jgi:hypothetical protein
MLLEGRASIDDEHHLLFDSQAYAGARQRYAGLQAIHLRDLMKQPYIGRVSWFVHECLTCADKCLHLCNKAFKAQGCLHMLQRTTSTSHSHRNSSSPLAQVSQPLGVTDSRGNHVHSEIGWKIRQQSPTCSSTLWQQCEPPNTHE